VRFAWCEPNTGGDSTLSAESLSEIGGIGGRGSCRAGIGRARLLPSRIGEGEAPASRDGAAKSSAGASPSLFPQTLNKPRNGCQEGSRDGTLLFFESACSGGQAASRLRSRCQQPISRIPFLREAVFLSPSPIATNTTLTPRDAGHRVMSSILPGPRACRWAVSVEQFLGGARTSSQRLALDVHFHSSQSVATPERLRRLPSAESSTMSLHVITHRWEVRDIDNGSLVKITTGTWTRPLLSILTDDLFLLCWRAPARPDPGFREVRVLPASVIGKLFALDRRLREVGDGSSCATSTRCQGVVSNGTLGEGQAPPPLSLRDGERTEPQDCLWCSCATPPGASSARGRGAACGAAHLRGSRRLREQLRQSGRTCVIRYVGETGGGD